MQFLQTYSRECCSSDPGRQYSLYFPTNHLPNLLFHNDQNSLKFLLRCEGVPLTLLCCYSWRWPLDYLDVLANWLLRFWDFVLSSLNVLRCLMFDIYTWSTEFGCHHHYLINFGVRPDSTVDKKGRNISVKVFK